MTDREKEILRVLDMNGFCTTRVVAQSVKFRTGFINRVHSARVRQLLLGMESRGLVRRLDAEKPVVWQRAKPEHGDG